MELVLKKGRPADETGRQARELRVYDLLESLHIPYERADHEAAFTMEACREVDKALQPAVICKNLFLCNRQQTAFYLLMIREDKKFRTKQISGQIGSSRLSFAPEAYMEQYLDTLPGSASVLSLMNDRDQHVHLLADEDVFREEYFGCHPCVNTSSLRLKTSDVFEKFLPAVGHGYTLVTLTDSGE